MAYTIKSVQAFESEVNDHNGDDIGPGFAVIVDLPPTTEHQKWQVAQAIQYALSGIVLEDE